MVKLQILEKLYKGFSKNWERAQLKINQEFLKSQKEMIDLEIQKQTAWEEKIINEIREIAKEENQELFILTF